LARDGGNGRQHYDRKIAELKTPKEAQRSLKRQLTNVVYPPEAFDVGGPERHAEPRSGAVRP